MNGMNGTTPTHHEHRNGGTAARGVGHGGTIECCPIQSPVGTYIPTYLPTYIHGKCKCKSVGMLPRFFMCVVRYLQPFSMDRLLWCAACCRLSVVLWRLESLWLLLGSYIRAWRMGLGFERIEQAQKIYIHIHSNNRLGDMFPVLSRSQIRRDFFKMNPLPLQHCGADFCGSNSSNFVFFSHGYYNIIRRPFRRPPKLDQLLIRGSHVALRVLGFVAQIWERKEKEGLMSLMDHDSNTGLCIITVQYI